MRCPPRDRTGPYRPAETEFLRFVLVAFHPLEIAFERYFESYDSSYALTLAYPDDLLLETARRHGIETEGREKNEIVKELFKKHGGHEYGS